MPKRGSKVRRKAVNLSLEQDLVEQAKALGLNVSQIAETALSKEVRRAQGEKWLEENAEAIKNHNERVAKKGMYNDGMRRF